MEFLRRHYEKVVLGVVLVGLLGWCISLWMSFNTVEHDLAELERKMNVIRVDSKPLPPVAMAEFNGLAALTDPRVAWAATGDFVDGTLFDPIRYIRCKNADCFFLLPYDSRGCPECATEQGETKDRGADSDNDGMPDLYEKKYPDFLDPHDARDALRDEDGDTFTNLEEFKAKSKPDVAADHPPYALHLRLVRVVESMLPIMLDKVTRAGDDQAKWIFQFSVLEGTRRITRFIKLGERAGEYRLLDVKPKTVTVRDPATRTTYEKDVSEVTVRRDDEEPVTLVREVPAYSKNQSAKLIFIRDPTDQNNCPVLDVQIGRDFTLTTEKDAKGESYNLQAATAQEAIVQRIGDAKAIEFRVRRFSPQSDLRRARDSIEERFNVPPGMGPGMPMYPPGMGPGPGPGPGP